MNPTPAQTPSGAAPGAFPAKPLRRRTLVLARGTWLVVAVLALGFFVAGIPSEFVMFHTVCQDVCTGGQLTPAGLRALRDLGLTLDSYATYAVVLDIVFATVYVAVAAIIFWRKSDERMAMLVSFALFTFGTAVLPNTMNALSIEHASLWWPLSLLNFLGASSFGLFVYLFPDGRFVPGWTRWVVFGWIAWQLPTYWFPSWDSFDLDGWMIWLAIAVWTAFLGTMIYAQIFRYWRVSGAMEQQQIKWVVFGISMAALAYLGIAVMLSTFAPAPTTPGTMATVLIGYTLLYAAMLLIPLSIGVAILRHHLFDIDLIINRTLVYGALTAGVAGLYVLVVGGLGQLLQLRGNLIISLLAAGLIAVLFAPLRNRLQRSVNRLMYGERDEPYTVLSRLGQRLEASLSPDAVLPTAVNTVKEAMKLPYVAIESKRNGSFEISATTGEPVGDPLRLPLTYGGVIVGQLVLGTRIGESEFSSVDQRLLENLTHQIGAAIHAAHLSEEAVRLSRDLQRSREKLVSAREEERLRLRRDLHDDELGPQLASLTMKTEAARDLLTVDVQRADALLGGVLDQAQEAVADIRRLVYALRPPALDALGLPKALLSQSRNGDHGGLSVSVEAPDELPPLPAAVEVAAYRIALEAMNNAAQHAKARNCTVGLSLEDVALRLEIEDDGRGIGKDHGTGIGLHSMRERAEELGGTFVIEPVPTGGTVVRAILPCGHSGA